MARYEGFTDKAGNEITFMEIYDLCRHSYGQLRKGQPSTVGGSTVNVEDEKITGGFAAYKVQKEGGWTAIVYRGSDDTRDWVFNNIPGGLSGPISFPPPQYRTGHHWAKEVGNGNTILVGHSLGGGIAMYAAAQEGLHAATIFPAPIQATWLGFPPWPARGTNITNYVSMGEVLSMAAYATSHMRFGRDVWIKTKGNPIDKHLLQNTEL